MTNDDKVKEAIAMIKIKGESDFLIGLRFLAVFIILLVMVFVSAWVIYNIHSLENYLFGTGFGWVKVLILIPALGLGAIGISTLVLIPYAMFFGGADAKSDEPTWSEESLRMFGVRTATGMDVVCPGPSNYEQVVAEIFVSVGDEVAPRTVLMRLEDPYLSLDIPAPMGGIVEAISVEVAETVMKGKVLLSLRGEAAPSSPGETAPGEKKRRFDL